MTVQTLGNLYVLKERESRRPCDLISRRLPTWLPRSICHRTRSPNRTYVREKEREKKAPIQIRLTSPIDQSIDRSGERQEHLRPPPPPLPRESQRSGYRSERPSLDPTSHRHQDRRIQTYTHRSTLRRYSTGGLGHQQHYSPGRLRSLFFLVFFSSFFLAPWQATRPGA